MSEHHIVPKRIYYLIFTALMVFTALTVWVAFIDLGPLNNVIAMSIACLKAALVITFFMHVKYGNKVIWLVVLGSLVWLAILFVFTLNDYALRGWLHYG